MTYNGFRAKVNKWPIIFSRDLISKEARKQLLRNQLNRWNKKGLLIKLRRGVFLLNDNDRKITPSRSYIHNNIYTPSYVSLEYALSYYGIIPEVVNALTGVTTRKTLRVGNKMGSFIYQHVKPEFFRGFKSVIDEAGFTFFIAEAEKAIMDFCYLNLKNFQGDYKSVFLDSYRFQSLEGLNAKKLLGYAKIFNNSKIVNISESLCALVREEKRII